MSRAPAHRSARIAAWIALAAPPVAWLAGQHLMNTLVRTRCALGGAPLGSLLGIVGLSICAAAAALAALMLRGRGPRGLDGAYVFVARVALGGAAVFAVAIGNQAIATLIVPPCLR